SKNIAFYTSLFKSVGFPQPSKNSDRVHLSAKTTEAVYHPPGGILLLHQTEHRRTAAGHQYTRRPETLHLLFHQTYLWILIQRHTLQYIGQALADTVKIPCGQRCFHLFQLGAFLYLLLAEGLKYFCCRYA